MKHHPTPLFILERIKRGQGIKWEEGKFFLLGMKGMIGASFSTIFLQRLLEEKIGYEKIMSLYYAHGKFQGQEGVRIFNKRFGYPRSFKELDQLLDVHIGQFQFTGTGKFEWAVKDIKNKKFIVKGKSPIAEEYALYFKTDNKFIDHFHRGLMAGFISEVLGEDLYCLETSCVAHGKEYCTFLIKKEKEFNHKSKDWKIQKIDKIDLLSSLNPKKKPLI